MTDASSAPARPNRVPVSVVTGFLGSGKTTLLNRLVRHPGMADTALIVNEFGEIGIDHELVDSAFENTVLLESGCICCSIRGDLIDTVNDLFANVEQGRVPPFARILVETTGLADPLPVVHALRASEDAAGRCVMGSIVTTVDAQQGEAQIARHEEASRQIAVADVVVVTKTDIARPGAADALSRRIEAINPGVAIRVAVQGEIHPDELFRHEGAAAARDAADLLRSSPGQERHDHAHHDDHDHDHAGALHEGIRANAVTADAPLSFERLKHFLETVFSLRGAVFLRVKGILQIEGIDRPVVVQGVGAGFSPPSTLPAWPEGPRRSRLVFIHEGLDGAGLEAVFRRMVLPPDRTAADEEETQ